MIFVKLGTGGRHMPVSLKLLLFSSWCVCVCVCVRACVCVVCVCAPAPAPKAINN